jgi:hypothetical protein
MDETLKASCQALKLSALHFLLGPLEGFLAKVTAFLGGDIPVYRGDAADDSSSAYNGDEVTLPAADRDNLKKQQFVKPERIQSVLSQAISTCIEAKPQFAEMTKVTDISLLTFQSGEFLIPSCWLCFIKFVIKRLTLVIVVIVIVICGQLYIENTVTRAVIIKPVLFEVQLARKRMVSISSDSRPVEAISYDTRRDI